MLWYKTSNTLTLNPKLGIIARNSARPRHEVIAFWVHILEKASRKSRDGSFGEINHVEIDYHLEYEQGVSEKLFSAFKNIGLIDDEKVTDWKEFQADPTNAERQRRHKEKKKNLKNKGLKEGNGEVTQNNQITVEESRVEENRLEKKVYTPLSPFEEFWEAYPKKEWIEEAANAFDDIDPGEYLRIIDAAKAYAASLKGKEHYAKSPQTWLENKGWLNEVYAAPVEKVLTEREKDFNKLSNHVWQIGYADRAETWRLLELKTLIGKYGDEAKEHIKKTQGDRQTRGGISYPDFVFQALDQLTKLKKVG